jgi:micrococcal nuclease
MSKAIVLSLFVALAITRCVAQTTIPVRNAAKHLGETVTVCEKVFSGRLLRASNTTLLDLGGDHPNQPLVVVIPGRDRNKFKGNPKLDYDGKDIMVTGKVVLYKGKRELLFKTQIV